MNKVANFQAVILRHMCLRYNDECMGFAINAFRRMADELGELLLKFEPYGFELEASGSARCGGALHLTLRLGDHVIWSYEQRYRKYRSLHLNNPSLQDASYLSKRSELEAMLRLVKALNLSKE